MAYFITILKVILFFLGTTQSKTSPSVKSIADLSILSDLLQDVLKQYIQSDLNVNLHESPIERIIKQKVAELKPMLQDDDMANDVADKHTNDVSFQKEDETAIIEISNANINQPYSSKILRDSNSNTEKLKQNIERYERTRSKINRALAKEFVSNKTQNLVTKTLDKMLTKLLSSKCLWKKLGDGTDVKNKSPKPLLTKDWENSYNELKTEYRKTMKDRSPSITDFKQDTSMYLDQNQEILPHIKKDAESYSFVCKLVKKDYRNPGEKYNDKYKNYLRRGDNEDYWNTKHMCDNFRVCSNELNKFMYDFYVNLNETGVNVFRSYAAMYSSEINTDDSNDKDSIIQLINKLGDLAEVKINHVFRKETATLKLDKKKNAQENVKHLKNYVKNIIKETRNVIKVNFENKFRFLRPEFLMQDISVNLDVELGNLENEWKKFICRLFTTCNGRWDRRHNVYRRSHGLGRKHIYVKLQASFINDKISKGDGNIRRKGADVYGENGTVILDNTELQRANVTRTTHRDLEKKNTTLASEINTLVTRSQ